MDIQLINPIEHNVLQRTEQWFRLRCGIITSSLMDPLMPAKSKAIDSFNQTQLSILSELAVQRMTGVIEDSFSSKHMARGTEKEPEGIQHYELKTMKLVKEVGFFTFLDYGDSPDGIVIGDRAIELKCPKTTTHFEYLKDPSKLFNKYKWQGYAHMIGGQVDKCDYISYDDRFPEDKKMVIYTENFNSSEATKLLDRLEICENKIKEYCNA